MFVGGLFTVFTMCIELMYICMFVHFYRKIMLLCFLFNVYLCVCNIVSSIAGVFRRKKAFLPFFIILSCLNRL